MDFRLSRHLFPIQLLDNVQKSIDDLKYNNGLSFNTGSLIATGSTGPTGPIESPSIATGDNQLISSILIDSPTSTITFSNVPLNYDAIRLNLYLRLDDGTLTSGVGMRINDNTSAANINSFHNYSIFNRRTFSYVSTFAHIFDAPGNGVPSGIFAHANLSILNYKETGFYPLPGGMFAHNVGFFYPGTGFHSSLTVCFGRPMIPMTGIQLFSMSGGLFATGSSARLYGNLSQN